VLPKKCWRAVSWFGRDDERVTDEEERLRVKAVYESGRKFFAWDAD